MRRFLGIIALAVALALPTAALAMNGMSNTNITLAKGTTHTGTYYAAGSNVTIDGDVNGDVICGGQAVIVNGAVNGDVICAAQNITINGPVSGSVRVAAQSVSINGTVGRNVTVVAQTLSVGTDAKVSGDMDVAGQSLSVGAPVTGELYAAGQTLGLQAPVGGNVNARVNQLNLSNDATVGGNLTYTSSQTIQVNKSQVKGDIVHKLPPARPSAQAAAVAWLGSLIYWILAALGGTLIAVWLLPRFVRSITDMMLNRPGVTIGWGFVGVFVAPVLLLALLFTVIGIPLAFFLGGFWVLALLASGAVAGVAVGRMILGRKQSDMRNLLLAALVGVPIVEIGIWLPWLGFIISIVIGAWALGGILLSLNRARSLA